MKHALAVGLFVLLAACSSSLAQPATTFPVRQPKYPPKTARTLYTAEQVALARENVKKYPSAKALADSIIRSADKWLEWKDDDLRFLLTTPDVPRAFAVSSSGCPVCGKKIKEAHGDYGWIVDLKQPFKVKCPVDGTVFPSNDYESYYRSGFKTNDNGEGKFFDNGWGYKDPKTGEKFWFVAYFNHWAWHKYLVPAMHELADAYLLTGDKRYAHKAAVMVYRVAEVYPGMDHENQSRYGEMMKAQGKHYPGKVVNLIWETGLAKHVCDAYDFIFDSIDSDAELQSEVHKTGPEIRSFIDANFIEDAIDAYFQEKIQGNFGMHQSCLVHLALVRQTGEKDKWFDGLMNEASGNRDLLGLNYALYNQVYRDGYPSETSPHYNFLWVSCIAQYGDQLQRAGVDVFGIPKVKRMFDAVLEQINVGRFTPSLGDAGGFQGDLLGDEPQTFQIAYEHYKDPRYYEWLTKLNATGDNSFKTFDALFKPPIEAPSKATTTPGQSEAPPRMVPPQKPRLLPGWGVGILNNPKDTVSLTLTYGQKHGHGHFDRLGFELFANGRPIMPDLGYPDAMNDFVPGIFTWSKNTISHNTVMVDQKRQPERGVGEVELFAECPFARAIDIEAKDTYPQCSTYRRAMVMVDVDDHQSYFVDIFTVAGGKQHDYSLHGPPGEFEMVGGKWSEPAKGTLAGENIALGQMYDDAKRAAADYKGGFSGYNGSGFQHLFNVRSLQSGDENWIVQWKDGTNPDAQLRIRVLNQPGQQMLLADAHASPAKYPQIIKYLIARRTGENLNSRFVSVIEPFKDKPFIKSVQPIEMKSGIGLEIERVDGRKDVVAYDPEGSDKKLGNLRTSATVSVDTFDAHQHPIRWFRNYLKPSNSPASPTTQTTAPVAGKVTDVLPLRSAVVVKLDEKMRYEPQSLEGRVAFFTNDRHRTAHTITKVEVEDGKMLLTFNDDILVGLAKVDSANSKVVRTSTALPLAPTYRGTTLSDEIFKLNVPVESVGDGKINLVENAPQSLKNGDKVWLLDIGVGDTMELPMVRWDETPN